MSKNEQIEKRVNNGLDIIDQIIDILYNGQEESQIANKFPQMTKQVICKNLRYSYEAVDNSIYFYLPGHNNKTIAKWIDAESRVLTIAEKADGENKTIFKVQINKKFDLHSVASEFKDGVLKVSFEEYAGKAETIEF